MPFSYNVLGTYAEIDAQPAPWLGLTGGLRYDHNAALGSDVSRQAANNVSPRVALFVADPERYGVKLLYAGGFRVASAFEGVFDDRLDFAANPDIKPEEIFSYEAVAWAKPRPGIALRLSGFYWDVSEIIEQRDVQLADGPRLQFKNIAHYVSAGLEAEAS